MLLFSCWVSLFGLLSAIQSVAGEETGLDKLSVRPLHAPHSVWAQQHHRHPHHLHQVDDDCENNNLVGAGHADLAPTYKRKASHSHEHGKTCHHFNSLHHPSHAMKQACAAHKKHINPFSTKSGKHQHLHSVSHDRERQSREALDTRSHSYHLIKSYSGKDFFDDMHFYTAADPSGGMIQYVDHATARHEGLIGTTKSGNAMMRIGHGKGGVQRSVRVSTSDTFTTGVFILDAYHMPTGCGVWPAFWTTPSDPSGGWPHGGEIDIVEGVHYFSRNMYSIHAPSSCSMPQSVNMLGQLAMPDPSLNHNCDPLKTDDQGCGVKSLKNGDYGHAYNAQGGGVHAMVWDSASGIRVYFFPRHAIPGDILANEPNPKSWGMPQASWPASHCKPDDYFHNHVAVFTNTVCGTWAGSSGVWHSKQGGQDFSCAAHTRKSSCYEYMRSGANLHTAYWEIASLKVYQRTRRR